MAEYHNLLVLGNKLLGQTLRVGRKVQQKALLNLGANFAIPKAQWAELVETIEARLAGYEFLFEPAPELTATAEAIVQKLRSREMVQAADEALMGDTANVQLDSLEMDNGRSVGCKRLALEALEFRRFSQAFKDVGMPDRDARITMVMVIAHMVHPSSERAALNWLETNSATLVLLRLDTGKGLKLDKLYRLGDVLVKHHGTIEDALFARQRKLFGTAGGVIFHDLTNTHMTGRPASKLARFGRSRQKRNDCPLVTLALATDEGDFPRRSSVLPDNVSEPGTLLDALDSLATEDEGEDKPTVIMDAGFATEDNLAALREWAFQ